MRCEMRSGGKTMLTWRISFTNCGTRMNDHIPTCQQRDGNVEISCFCKNQETTTMGATGNVVDQLEDTVAMKSTPKAWAAAEWKTMNIVRDR